MSLFSQNNYKTFKIDVDSDVLDQPISARQVFTLLAMNAGTSVERLAISIEEVPECVSHLFKEHIRES